jgi:asparagine synthase (glutamine-hydrolysing)
MCGFLVMGGDHAEECDLRPLVLELLGRRGPDGVEQASFDLAGVPIRLGHAQFDVMDRSGKGGQPMTSSSGRSTIVYNGEIYNHIELAESLGAPAGGWQTRTDTEVLLEGLERDGPDFLGRTNGMFAFVFVRHDSPEILVARDRLGIRPVYHAQAGENWAVGSTLRSVLATGVVPFELSSEGLRSFLTFGSVYEPHTIARNVQLLAPGTWRRWRPGRGWEERSWWSLPEPAADHGPPPPTEEIRAILLDAVSVRTRSGYPLGAFVSGGTDSSTIAILLAEELQKAFSSFSLTFAGSDSRYTESRYQQKIVERCGSTHHETLISQNDAATVLDEYFDQMDQPSIDGFNIFLISRQAATTGVRTCLAGTGGDEVFAGYSTFASAGRFSAAFRRLDRLPGPVRSALALPLSALSRLRPLEPRLSKPAHLLGRTGNLAEYYGLRRALFLPAQVQRLTGCQPKSLSLELSHRPESTSTDVVNLWSAFELGNYLRNTLMRDGDVFSMAHAVEVRFPMLDHRLVEAVLRVSGSSKVSATEHKPLLLGTMRGALPRFTWDRPKQGFTLPWEEWLQRDLLPSPDLSAWLDRAEVRHIVRGFRSNPTNQRSWSRLWALHVLERCLRRGYARSRAA